MPTTKAQTLNDCIRIVPLYLPKEVRTPTRAAAPAAAAPAQLTYRKGPLIAACEVVTIFWGDAWTKAEKPMVAQLNGFFDFILTSPLIDQLGEYSTRSHKIRHGKRTASITVRTPAPKKSTTDAALQTFLKQQISKKAVPKATANTLYFIYTPPGVRVVMGGSASCQAFCGYHNAIGTTTFYAVMPYPGCNGCTGDLTEFDALTSTSSHELCEAITDPIPGSGWYDDTNGEIGDICAWQTKKVGDYTVQLEWSNAAGKCI